MSLVEDALKKLRESGAGKSAAAAAASIAKPALTAPVPAPVSAPLAAAAPVPRRSDKLVRFSREGLRAAGLFPPERDERQLATEYRLIKRPLVSAAMKGDAPNARLLMVGSSLPGDGKTFTTVNLALSLALERDLSVLLVDGDFAKPHISTALGVREEPGLLDALADELLDVESAVMSTDVRGLSLLPAGHVEGPVTELVASARMGQVVARLLEADPRRIVIFDSSPLLLASEPRVLAAFMGQIVLVVRAVGTPRAALAEALDSLGEGKPVSLILNQNQGATPAAYYGYPEYGASPATEKR